VRRYKIIRQANPSDPSIAERRLRLRGYQLLRSNKTDEAIAIFMANVELYPQFWNAYDCLGEAFAKKGDKESAIQNYEHALRLNPGAETAKKALQELRK